MKYRYRYKHKVEYGTEIKKLKWIDSDVGDKLFLSCGVNSEIFSPNYFGRVRVVYKATPNIFIYKLKNIIGCIESSSFYCKKNIYVERFQGVEQVKANYAAGHLMINHSCFCVTHKYNDYLKLSGKALFLGGNGSGNYFHWIIEILPKLTSFLKQRSNIELIDYIVVNERVREVESFASSLTIVMAYYKIDTPIKYVNVNTAIYFDEVLYITTFNHVLFNSRDKYNQDYCYFSKENLLDLSRIFTFDVDYNITLKDKFPSIFFIKRGRGISGYNKRNYNEDEIVGVVSHLNIKCIYIEDYSFVEQVKLFSNAKLIIAPSGAFFTNLIFCKKNTSIISWLTPNLSDFSVYSTISHLFDLDMNFILAEQSQNEGIHGEYYLNPNEFRNFLSQALAKIENNITEVY